MKTYKLLSIIVLLLTYCVTSSYAQQDKKIKPQEKITLVNTTEKRNVNKTLRVKGFRDSSYIKLLGVEKSGRPVNVSCVRKDTEEGVKYEDKRDYQYYYEGKDSFYKWTIVFYTDRTEDILIIQQSQGSYKTVDTFVGEYLE